MSERRADRFHACRRCVAYNTGDARYIPIDKEEAKKRRKGRMRMAAAHIERENIGAEDELAKARERADKAEAELASLKGTTGDDTDTGDADEAETEMRESGGEEELRKDSMMAHLLDSLEAGKDIGHYGRLTFAMVARHFLSHDEVLAWLTKDSDFDEEKAEAMLGQVEASGYNPPKRDRILEWQKEQEFPIMPDASDPDCGNLYRTLKFPDAVYKHIEEYREQKQHSA